MSTNLKKPCGKEKLQEFLLRRKQRELGLFCWGRTQADLLQKAGIPASLNSWGKKKPRGRQSSQQGVSPHATRFSEQCFFPVGWLISSFLCPCHLTQVVYIVTAPQPQKPSCAPSPTPSSAGTRDWPLLPERQVARSSFLRDRGWWKQKNASWIGIRTLVVVGEFLLRRKAGAAPSICHFLGAEVVVFSTSKPSSRLLVAVGRARVRGVHLFPWGGVVSELGHLKDALL